MLAIFVRLNALVIFIKTLRLRGLFPLPFPCDDVPKKNAFEILKLKVTVFGPGALLRGMPEGRSLTIPSRLSSLPVVMLYQFGPTIDMVSVRNSPKGSRAFTVLFTLCVG